MTYLHIYNYSNLSAFQGKLSPQRHCSTKSWLLSVFLTDTSQKTEQCLAHSKQPININLHLLGQANIYKFSFHFQFCSVRISVPKQYVILNLLIQRLLQESHFSSKDVSSIKYLFVISPHVGHHAGFSLIR